MCWASGNCKIELNITKAQARLGSHRGTCDQDIAELRTVPAIRRQLAKPKPADVAEVLRDYELDDGIDHDANLSRLLWIACGDIVEGLPWS
jgi:hypothetical protein